MNSVLHLTSSRNSKVFNSLYNTLHVQYKKNLPLKFWHRVAAGFWNQRRKRVVMRWWDLIGVFELFTVITATASSLNAVILGTLKVWHFVVILTRLHSIVWMCSCVKVCVDVWVWDHPASKCTTVVPKNQTSSVSHSTIPQFLHPSILTIQQYPCNSNLVSSHQEMTITNSIS